MDKREKILIDKKLDDDLFENGFVIVPFLNIEELSKLKSFFYEHHDNNETGLIASVHSPDQSFRALINEKIREVFKRSLNEYFLECRPLGGSYITKAPGKNGILQPHQDWNIVNEEEHRSFNIWVPLIDVNKKNGAVHILPNSHNKRKTFRGSNFPNMFQDIFPQIWRHMDVLEMNAGEALIYDHRLLHASPPNLSEEWRIAVVYGIISQKAEMKYYYKKDNIVEEYACNPDFYLRGNPVLGPGNNKKLREIQYDASNLDEQKFTKIYLPKSHNSFSWDRVRKLFLWT